MCLHTSHYWFALTQKFLVALRRKQGIMFDNSAVTMRWGLIWMQLGLQVKVRIVLVRDRRGH